MSKFETMREHDKGIYEFLKENGIYADVYTHNQIPVVSIDIDMGDWKHEHLHCDHLMKSKGYHKIGEQNTTPVELMGDDCYSSTHNYILSAEVIKSFSSFKEE